MRPSSTVAVWSWTSMPEMLSTVMLASRTASRAASSQDSVERVGLTFDRWGDPHAQGPGLYVLVEDTAATAFVESMGRNRWPVEDCASALETSTRPEVFAVVTLSEEYGRVTVFRDGTFEHSHTEAAVLE